MNKKYAALITIALIAHITNAEQDKPTEDSNYSKKRIEKDYGLSLPLFLDSTQQGIGTSPKVPIEFVWQTIAIEDNKGTDHVKVIIRDIRKKSSLAEKENGDTFVLNTVNKPVQIVYNKPIGFLSIDTFKKQTVEEREEQENLIAMLYSGGIPKKNLKLQSVINPDQRKICYNKEKRELTITIPRIIEQNKGIDGDGE